MSDRHDPWGWLDGPADPSMVTIEDLIRQERARPELQEHDFTQTVDPDEDAIRTGLYRSTPKGGR